MITCYIRYTLDSNCLSDFRVHGRRLPPIRTASWPTRKNLQSGSKRCGGDLVGYFRPKEAANNFALALIDFENLGVYEKYRKKLTQDNEAKANVRRARKTQCILVEDRTFPERG